MSLLDAYLPPKHQISVSALIENNEGEVLLVKTHWRSDTWEFPGGNVEEGESLDVAITREVLEETGILIRPIGITGVYYKETSNLLSVVFRAEFIDGQLKIQPEEIMEAMFVSLTVSNIEQYITRPHMISRSLDAIRSKGFVPYEFWKTKPFQRISRLDPNGVQPEV
ncbi:NUDIX hydrolase [Paenibacillus dokdonensis]|uniref:NUDIX hydrolase n=1 Tax=Paenibacillus dokdonensis TaxID=2567944 RepID=A0ABU6GJM8_9BACL|nr:NUDIX hydrolase [Paenibacillus dokdonensis]MEC0239913.1 NUDIX hydrolase [Paenibacillus dokdonensis]